MIRVHDRETPYHGDVAHPWSWASHHLPRWSLMPWSSCAIMVTWSWVPRHVAFMGQLIVFMVVIHWSCSLVARCSSVVRLSELSSYGWWIVVVRCASWSSMCSMTFVFMIVTPSWSAHQWGSWVTSWVAWWLSEWCALSITYPKSIHVQVKECTWS